MVGYELDLADVNDTIKLEGDLLGVRAETTGLPSLATPKEETTDGVLGLF